VPYLLLGSEGRPVAFSYRPAFRFQFVLGLPAPKNVQQLLP